MKLLLFAHKGEAGAFLQGEKHVLRDDIYPGLYESRQWLLYITGSSFLHLTDDIISLHDKVKKKLHAGISVFINPGTAGSLDSSLSYGRIVSVRTSLLETSERGEESCYISGDKDAVCDCVTCQRSVDTISRASVLSGRAQIADMELFYIAKAAYRVSVPYFSYKVISDRAGINTDINLIKEKAGDFSLMLFDFFNRLSNP